jgi:hypothetical protein
MKLSQNRSSTSEIKSESQSSADSQEIKKYIIEFKKDIEIKYENSIANQNFKFPRKTNKNSFKEKSLKSLKNVKFYDLDSSNVKNFLKRISKDKSQSKSKILLNTVKKLGKLDERYLLSQLKDTKSDFFKILFNNVKEVKNAELKKKIKFKKLKPSSQQRIKKSSLYINTTKNNSKSKFAPITSYLNLQNQILIPKNVNKRESPKLLKSSEKFHKNKLKSLEKVSTVRSTQRKPKNKSMKNMNMEFFGKIKPNTSRSYIVKDEKKLNIQNGRQKLAQYFKEANKENISKDKFVKNTINSLKLINSLKNSQLQSLIEKKLYTDPKSGANKESTKKIGKVTLGNFKRTIQDFCKNNQDHKRGSYRVI